MASVSVKSFMIADILVNKSKCEEKSENEKLSVGNFYTPKKCKTEFEDEFSEKAKNTGTQSSRESSPSGSIVATRKMSTCTPSSSPSSSEDDTKDVKSPIRSARSTSANKYHLLNLPGSFYQYPAFPMPFQMSTFPMTGAANRLTEAESDMKNYHNILSYNLDSFRQSRQLFSRSQAALSPMLLPSVSALSHGGHLSQAMDYASYPNFPGLYGLPVPSSMAGLHDKGSLMSSRDNFPILQLGRSMLSGTCKRKGGQIRFSNSQTAQLEKAFVQQKYLNANDRKKLAHSLALSDRQVKTWFQNRRAKLRKCKGGMCAESEVSRSPQDQRVLSPQNENHYESLHDANKLPHFTGPT